MIDEETELTNRQDAPSIAAPAPPPPTFTGTYPKLFYSRFDRVPPLVIRTAEEEAAVNLDRWEQIPPPEGAAPKVIDPAAEWPKLMYNINCPPVVVNNAEDVAALGTEYRVYTVPPAIVDVLKPAPEPPPEA